MADQSGKSGAAPEEFNEGEATKGKAGPSKATGRAGSGESERNASEPMDRTEEHKGSYGGEGGSPRTSSDQRESHGKDENS